MKKTTKQTTDDDLLQSQEELRVAFLKLIRSVNAFYFRWGFTFTNCLLIDYLNNHRDHAEAAEAADELAIPRQTMTALLDGLEKQGVVVRLPHPQDRRRKIIRLTPLGIEKIQTLQRETRVTELAAWKEMGDADMRNFVRLMRKQRECWERAAQAYDGPVTPFC
jgi:DNA-binding MarR family transcriptional regulator